MNEKEKSKLNPEQVEGRRKERSEGKKKQNKKYENTEHQRKQNSVLEKDPQNEDPLATDKGEKKKRLKLPKS